MSQAHDKTDFTLISQPITKKEIQQFTPGNSPVVSVSNASHTALLIVLAIALVSTIYIGALTNSSFSMTLESTGFYILVIAIAAIALLCGIVMSHRAAKKLAILNRFAVKNNIVFDTNATPTGHNGLIFQYGHTQRIKQSLTFPDGLQIGNYTYTTGSGKNTKVHTWGYACIFLNKALPHMILDAKSNNIFQRFSNLPESFESNQRLSLEGDFDSHFTLFAPEEYKRDALYIFTPDVMAKLIDLGKNYDIEVVDDTLYLYSNYPIKLDSEDTLRAILTVIDTIGNEIKSQNENYRDERVTDTEIAVKQHSIAPQGVRLKKRLDIVSILTICFAIAFYIYMFAVGN